MGRQRSKPGKVPKLAPLAYGNPYCELCKERLSPGDLVAWWEVVVPVSVPAPANASLRETRSNWWKRVTRWAVYCATCHWENVREGRALR